MPGTWSAPAGTLMLEEVLASDAINTDDTPVKLRDAHGKQKCQGRLWTYVGDDLHPPTVLRYTPNRTDAAYLPERFLSSFRDSEQQGQAGFAMAVVDSDEPRWTSLLCYRCTESRISHGRLR